MRHPQTVHPSDEIRHPPPGGPCLHEIARAIPAALFLLLVMTPLAKAQGRRVAFPIPNPVFVNIYWDYNWDADNPTMSMALIDNFTEALVSSSYLGGLAEYYPAGIAPKPTFFSKSFKGSPGSCGSDSNGKPPAKVALFDLLGIITQSVTIDSFVSCTVTLGLGTAGANNFIYNIFLPPTTIPFVGTSTMCVPDSSGSTLVGYHYEVGLSGVVYTVIPTNSGCASSFNALTSNLTHEMVEATTDPYASLADLIVPQEIADGSCNSSSSTFLTAGNAQYYFSNSGLFCFPGFSDATTPKIDDVILNGWGPQMKVTVKGSGFGNLPTMVVFPASAPGSPWNSGAAVQLPQSAYIPYFLLRDQSANWQAGSSLSGGYPLHYASWSDAQVVIDGFFPSQGPMPSEVLVFTVCNPGSGRCANSIKQMPPAPIISSVIPSGGPPIGGTPISITGSGFDSTRSLQVSFGGGNPVPATGVTPTQVTAVTPPTYPGQTTVQVVNGSVPSLFGLFDFCGPQIRSVQPNSGQAGTTVSISGTCLTGASSVMFGVAGKGQNVKSVSDTTVTASAPQLNVTSCGIVNVQVLVSAPGMNVWSPTTIQGQFSYGNPNVCPNPGGGGGGTGAGGNNDPCKGPNPPNWCTDPCFRPHPPPYCSHVRGVISHSSASAPSTQLDDAVGNDAEATAIRTVLSQGLLEEVSPGRFAPKQFVTRGEFATAFGRAFRFSKPIPPPWFVDVPPTALAYQFDILVQPYLFRYPNSSGGLSFHPELPVERDEAASAVIGMLTAAGKLKPLAQASDTDAALENVSDRNRIPEHLKSMIASSIKAGFLSVDANGALHPRSFLTRGELALLLAKMQAYYSGRPR